MLESFATGAVFRVQNEASATLNAILRQVTEIEGAATRAQAQLSTLSRIRFGGVSTSLGGLDRRLASTTARSEAMRTVMTDSLSAVTAGLTMAARTAHELAAGINEVIAASRVMGRTGMAQAAGGGAAAAGGGGRRGGTTILGGMGGGGHINAYGGAGPIHGRMGLGALGLMGAAMGYGVYEEAQARDVAARMMLTSIVPIDSGMSNTETFGIIRSTLQTAMTKTGLGAHDLEGAMLTSIRQLAPMPLKERLAAIPGILDFAATEARFKGSSVEESTEALIGLFHSSGVYDPEGMQKLASRMAFASTISPLSLQAMSRSFSYAGPTLRAGLGMDPGSLLLLMGQMQSAGVLSTKAGTWAQQFFTMLSPSTSLASIMSGRGGTIRANALRQLGMIDAKGGLVGAKMAAAGDFVGLAKTINESLEKVPQERKLTLLNQAFGAQGGRFAALFQDKSFIGRLPELQAQQDKFSSVAGENFLQMYGAGSEVQQARKTMAEFTAAMMNLGAEVLPALTSVMTSLTETLQWLRNFYDGKGTPTAGQVLGNAGKNAAAAGAVGMFLGGPPGAAIAGGAAGAGTVILGGNKMLNDTLAKDGLMMGPNGYPIQIPKGWKNANPNAPALPPAGSPLIHKEAFTMGGDGGGQSFSFQGNTIIIYSNTSDAKDLAESVIREINQRMSDGHAHNLGPADGSLSSPWTSGADI